jgi:hypothetical protein
MPVGPEGGASEAELKNAQPQCLSDGSDGLVFCQVGCTTVIPMQSLSPAYNIFELEIGDENVCYLSI